MHEMTFIEESIQKLKQNKKKIKGKMRKLQSWRQSSWWMLCDVMVMLGLLLENASIRVKLRPERPAMHPKGLAPLIVSQ